MQALEKLIESLKGQRTFAGQYKSDYTEGYREGLRHAIELAEIYLKAEQDKAAIWAR